MSGVIPMSPQNAEARDPNAISIEFPDGRRLRPTRAATSPGGARALALFIAGVLLGTVALATGYWLGGGAPAQITPPPETGSYTLKAFITGFIGVGGTIDGVKNPDLKVNEGDRITITLINGESIEHNLAIDELSVDSPHVRLTGEQVVVTFDADQMGTFAYYCALPGHRQAGMEGKIIVGQGSTTGPGPAKPVDVADIVRNATDLPPPIARNTSATVDLYLEAVEVTAEIQPGTTFTYWTFNGRVPGPFFRVRVNDTVTVHFANAATSTMDHSVDFHSVNGPGGGAARVQTPPGQEKSFTFRALNPGIFVYHCASPHIPTHISMGMYGLILVEPEGGLPPVDKEFYVMQGEIYTKWPAGTAGHQEFDGTKLGLEQPTYVMFNGKFQGLTGNDALHATVNETVRIFFGVGGPNLISAFHVIGEIFDRVYSQGDVVSPPAEGVQTTLVAPGGATVVEFKVNVPATYLLVDHSLQRTIDKGCLGFLVVTGPDDPTVFR